ncbi:MAG: hypothetical protein COU47_02115 [Candidatus Niyogibacteria bacterium CG10_big_fil_rev_8_21_14_0_10_46_36]|uniref:Octanoyltransferase n=1 Tax=Candidatus Niyogibacteria bacterium CG10_big_fil_rev_8_21_14_0_10_46_36 TaxID=1974726 RepID=A0A2H0TDA8_9BACT|nr:MAG: hypothetical protein COU47_02115 [Candidatus Niyogibacteria bacterium CG10_big_fil_rev_8_21_14_0_10_46_36]
MNPSEHNTALLAWDFFPQATLRDINYWQEKLLAKKMKDAGTCQFMLCTEHMPCISYQDESNIDTQLRIDHTEFWQFVQRNRVSIEKRKFSTGGGITYHGPGQLTLYFIASHKELGLPHPKDFSNRILLALDMFFRKYCGMSAYTIRELFAKRHSLKFVRDALEALGVRTENDINTSGASGLWIVDKEYETIKKIVSYGGRWKPKSVTISDSIVLSGFGININTDLSYFNNIIQPCGLDIEVTSIREETGHCLSAYETAKTLSLLIADTLGMKNTREGNLETYITS